MDIIDVRAVANHGNPRGRGFVARGNMRRQCMGSNAETARRTTTITTLHMIGRRLCVQCVGRNPVNKRTDARRGILTQRRTTSVYCVSGADLEGRAI